MVGLLICGIEFFGTVVVVMGRAFSPLVLSGPIT